MIFGRWSDALIGTWIGGEILVNPYLRAIQAEVVITLNLFVAVAFRYSSALVSSSDTALRNRSVFLWRHARSQFSHI